MKVAMVNQEFVNKFLKGKDPMRQRVLVEELIPGVTKLGPPHRVADCRSFPQRALRRPD